MEDPIMNNNLIMAPLNAVFLAVFAFFVLLLVIASLFFRKKSDRAKRWAVAVTCLVNCLFFVLYKIFLSKDAEYNVIQSAMGGFNWWGELPLHLCNINMWLVIVGVLLDKRSIMRFCFFAGPIGAAMALFMPGNGFSGYSLLLPRMLGYYITHFLVMITCLSLGTFGLLKPELSDLPKTLIVTFIIAFLIHLVNTLFRITGLYEKANYFYTIETEGNFLLEIFYRWIPLPFLYLIPGLAILAVYVLLVTGLAALVKKPKRYPL